MADSRTLAEIAGGYIDVSLAGGFVELPTLKLKAERQWRGSLTKQVGDLGLDLDTNALRAGGDEAYNALGPLVSAPADIILELVLSYDVQGKLGTREWLEENADSAQLYAILRQILSVVFPFVEDLRSALAELAGLLEASGQFSSTSGRSSTGASAPSVLNGHSTENSSTPSGKPLSSVSKPTPAQS